MLPNLSLLSGDDISVPVTPDLTSMKRLKSDKVLHNVLADGSCLYHCLVKLRAASAQWLKDDVPFPPDSDMLKLMMGQYFVSNYETIFMERWKYYLRRYLKISNLEAEDMNPVDIARRYAQAVIMKPRPKPEEFGGELEIDIASHMFGVIIHKFERGTANVPDTSAILTASFYPNEELSDENNTTSKWIIVLIVDHYNYVVPLAPRNMKIDPRPSPKASSSSSSSSSSQTARERAEYINRTRNRRGGERESPALKAQNMMLKRYAQERKERQQREKSLKDPDSPTCLLHPIERLGVDEEKQINDLESEIEKDDEALARRLQEEENERVLQIERDRKLAVELS